MEYDRRNFLKMTGAGVAGMFIVPIIQGCESQTITPLVEPSAEPFLTPNSQFFLQNGGEGAIQGWSQPVFNSANDWSLSIKNGNTEVGVITFDDVISASQEDGGKVTLLKTIECVLQSEVRVSPTGFTGNAYWTGVPLSRLLDGIDLSASSSIKRLLFTGADGFTNNITIERIRDAAGMGLPEPLLAYQMNGESLPPEHGFPVRLIIQEGYGYKNVKWLTEVQAIAFDIEFGTYQDQNFVDDGIQRVNSRATSLFDQIQVSSGPSMIFGFALSGFAPIEKVEVSIDGGLPEIAEIVPLQEIEETTSLPPNIQQIMASDSYPFLGVWTPWRFEWEATRGDHEIAVRAYDQDGNVQPDTDETIEDGQNGMATYRVTVS